MSEWSKSQYQDLLTKTIWKSTAKEVKAILSLTELKEERYKHLLKPSIFAINGKNIIPTIKLFQEYGIDTYITNRCLRRNIDLQRSLLEYMCENNMDLIGLRSNGTVGLNPILNANNVELKQKYSIDIKRFSSKGEQK